MLKDLTAAARDVLLLAEEEARQMNHDFIGTEHILLGIVTQNSDVVRDVLAAMGVDSERVRREVERLIERGAKPVTTRRLPWTPRAKQAIQFAIEGATNFDGTAAGTEHLLIGLAREPEGVASKVLANLGVKPDDLRTKVIKIRIAQMKVVERAVRPVRASTARKRKMREELFMHLTAIYDQELARLRDPNAALAAAARRFGDPLELADELQTSLPYHERISHFVEYRFAWRAPESVARYALRQAAVTLCILAVVLPLVGAGVILRYGWFEGVGTFIRVLASILLITPPAQCVITAASIKMRDSLWGIFGSRKSLIRALLYDAVIAAVVLSACVGFAWAVRWDVSLPIESLAFCSIVGVLGALASLIVVRVLGPVTIRDTLWAMLDIETA
jgi:hypothetical protein